MVLSFEGLLQLQQIDHQKVAFRDRLNQLPVELEKIRQRAAAAQQAQADAQQAVEQCQKQRRTKESDLQAQEERINKLKTRLGEIKTNKEYHAHLAEIETAKLGQTAIEDELLTLMEQTETVAQQLKQRQAELATAKTAAAAEEAKLEEERRSLEQQLERLKTETAALAPSLEPGLLKDYERLRERLKGSVIVPIQHDSCTGCRLAVPPQLIAEVRRQEAVQHCPHCGRFLYWPHAAA